MVLAAGSDAQYISVWSVGNWKKQFMLNNHVGIRSVYGFHPRRGDLAFDGSHGVIQVLPNYGKTVDIKKYGVVNGIEVMFDQAPYLQRLETELQIWVPNLNQCDRRSKHL